MRISNEFYLPVNIVKNELIRFLIIELNFYQAITKRFYASLNLSRIVSQAFFGINLKDEFQDKAVLKYTEK